MALIKVPEDRKKMDKLKKQLENQETIKYTINIPVKLHTRFKERAASNRMNMKDILIQSIKDYLKA